MSYSLNSLDSMFQLVKIDHGLVQYRQPFSTFQLKITNQQFYMHLIQGLK